MSWIESIVGVVFFQFFPKIYLKIWFREPIVDVLSGQIKYKETKESKSGVKLVRIKQNNKSRQG